MAKITKADARAICRAHWGKTWYKVHPLIKKARIAWALSEFSEWGLVNVHEGGRSYVV